MPSLEDLLDLLSRDWQLVDILPQPAGEIRDSLQPVSDMLTPKLRTG